MVFRLRRRLKKHSPMNGYYSTFKLSSSKIELEKETLMMSLMIRFLGCLSLLKLQFKYLKINTTTRLYIFGGSRAVTLISFLLTP